MEQETNNITKILLYCEENGTAPKFIVEQDTYKEVKDSLFGRANSVRTTPIEYNTNGEEIFVVSDLHIASGRNNVGVYKGTENFFADDPFYRFLEHATKKADKSILIINSDIFDFPRVTEFPGKVKRIRLSKRIKHTLKLQPLTKLHKTSAQNIDEDSLQEEIERMEFSPWNTTEDFRPLGSLNRAKKRVYHASQTMRRSN
jgi:hypothetical protein